MLLRMAEGEREEKREREEPDGRDVGLVDIAVFLLGTKEDDGMIRASGVALVADGNVEGYLETMSSRASRRLGSDSE